MTLIQRISSLMKQQGMNQKKFAEATGWSAMMVSRILSGTRKLKEDEIALAATALGVTVDTLLSPIEERTQYDPMIQKYQNSRLSVEEAARLMGKRPMFVRIALRQRQLPFGVALKGTGDKYTYYISKKQFEEYTGIKVS